MKLNAPRDRAFFIRFSHFKRKNELCVNGPQQQGVQSCFLRLELYWEHMEQFNLAPHLKLKTAFCSFLCNYILAAFIWAQINSTIKWNICTFKKFMARGRSIFKKLVLSIWLKMSKTREKKALFINSYTFQHLRDSSPKDLIRFVWTAWKCTIKHGSM